MKYYRGKLFSVFLGRIGFLLYLSCVISLQLLASSCRDDNPVSNGKPRAPFIDSVSSSIVAPGQVLIIYGKSFATETSANVVEFNNALAKVNPYVASSTRLELKVPENAATGPMWVETDGGASDSTIIEVSRGIGDVWVVEGESSPYSFKVRAASGGEAYLIIPHSAAENSATYTYNVGMNNSSVFPAPQRMPDKHYHPLGIEERFTSSARQEVVDYLLPRKGGSFRIKMVPGPERAYLDVRNYYVLNTTTGSTIDPASFTQVTATLRYTGSRCLIYSDQNMPPAGFVQADYDSFGTRFDQDIYVADSTYFGQPTDINKDARVVILFTPVVNDLTAPGTAQNGFIAGFFLLNDLLPNALPTGTSNGLEIFYVMVPDVNGQHGNVFTKANVQGLVPKVLAHEFEHMISFGFRLFNYGIGSLQEVWLEEGMAHMAEDLNGMNDDNVKRANYFLPDPGAVSLVGGDTLEQRGAIYLFLRYLGDQLGGGIYRNMLQSSTIGTATVEYVTGANFFASFSDWLATLYLSNRSITSNTRYNYNSINLQDPAFVSLGVGIRNVSQGAITNSIKGASGDFYEVQNPSPPGVEFTANPSSQASNLRVIVVRIQ